MRALLLRIQTGLAAAALGASACYREPPPPPVTPPPVVVVATVAEMLDVRVEARDDTGTMHYADRVEIRSRSSPSPLVLETGADYVVKSEGPVAPLVGRQVRVDPEHVLLLGWSSLGGGMQTDHALLVRASPGRAPVVIDTLALTTDRTSAGFALDTARGVRVGIADVFHGHAMHDADDWRLELRDRTLDLAGLRRLPFVATNVATTGGFFPPFGLARWTPDTRVAWFEATPAGFRAR